VRIRHFGFPANRFRASRLALIQHLLSSNSSTLVENGTLQSFGGGFFCLALPTLRRDHNRGSEIYECGIINMLLLRFFITPLPLSTRGCAQARGRTLCPLPLHYLVSKFPHALLLISAAAPTIRMAFPPRLAAPFRSRLPFKSHSAPRPPQTPAASS
jgi:hypothetical protein